MQNKKWITITLMALFSLVALGAVGLAGFRIGLMRGASLVKFTGNPHAPFLGQAPQDFDREFNKKDRDNKNPHRFGDDDRRGFDHKRKFDRGDRGGFLALLSGLFHLAVLGLLAWIGFMLYKRSGWQFVRVSAPPQADESASDAKVAKKKK